MIFITNINWNKEDICKLTKKDCEQMKKDFSKIIEDFIKKNCDLNSISMLNNSFKDLKESYLSYELVDKYIDKIKEDTQSEELDETAINIVNNLSIKQAISEVLDLYSVLDIDLLLVDNTSLISNYEKLNIKAFS